MIARTRKFRHRLNRLVVAQLVITALFAGSKIHRDFSNIDRRLHRDIDSGVTAVSAVTTDFIDKYTGILHAIRQVPFVAAADTEKTSSLFRRLNADFPEVVNFAATAADGRFFASGKDFDGQDPPTVRHLDFFQAVAGGDRRFIMTPHVGPISNAVVTGVAIPLQAENGEFKGLVGCSIRLDALTRKWEAVFRQSDVSYLIIDRKQRIIAASAAFAGKINQPVSAREIDPALLTEEDGSASARIAGQRCQYRTATLEDSGLRLIGFKTPPTVIQFASNHPEYITFGIPLVLLIGLQIVMRFRDRAIARDLSRSETRYQELVESLHEGIWAIDENNRTAYVNARMAEMLGTSVDEMLGRSLFDYMDEAGAVDARQKLDHRMQGEAEQHEFTFVRRDGSRLHTLLATAPRLDDNGSYAGAVAGVLDITEYKSVQETLKQRENLLNETGRMAKIGGWVFDVHSRNGTWTEETARIHDMAPGEVTNVEMGLSFFHGKHREAIELAVNEAISMGRPYDLELEMVTASGNRKWVRTVGKPIAKDGHLVSVGGMIQDITERKQAEENLRNSERILRTVIDTSPNCVFVKDDQGAYILVNKSVANLYGATPREMIGVTDVQLASAKGLSEEDARRFADEDAQVIASHKPLPIFKEHITLADGSIRWFRTIKVPIAIPGHPRCVLGVATDITDQVASEEQQALLFTAIEQSPEAVIITDREGIIQFVNPAFETITGFAGREAVGRNPRILKSDEHDEAFYRTMWETLLQGDTWKGRIVNRKKDGTKYTEDATISPVRSRGGTVMHYVAVKRDITGELETETRLRQAQKMEAIGTLAGGIAHDFNNILTSIVGFTELALEHAEKGSDLESHLKEVFISGMRARDLVKQILTFARQSEEEVKAVEFRRIVSETVKFLRSTIPSSIEICTEIENKGHVLADPTQLHQVCMNLCTNAVHAMEEKGGVLKIRLMETYLEQGIAGRHGDRRPGRYLVLSIADTGCGIPAEVIDTIFEPYFTTKGIGEGTGLGLAVVHGIVKGCGGEIRVESQPGKGTVFSVYLPKVDDRQENTDTAEAEDVPGGREHILVVDDELVIAKVVGQVLERHGYRIMIRTSSVEALALFQCKPDRFDLVITDMTMPNLTGDLLAAELLKLRPDLPVILCTGYSSKLSEERVAALGIKSLIMKPFSRQAILKSVRSALDESMQGQR